MPSQTHTRRPIRPKSERTTKELQNLRNNYIRTGRTEGGLYSLAEVNRELFHRLECSEIAGERVVREIASMIRETSPKTTTYGKLFSKLHGRRFVGNASQQKIGKDLGRATLHCILNELPVYTVLVVNQETGELTAPAKENIYNGCKEMGLRHMPASVETFIDQQRALALEHCYSLC